MIKTNYHYVQTIVFTLKNATSNMRWLANRVTGNNCVYPQKCHIKHGTGGSPSVTTYCVYPQKCHIKHVNNKTHYGTDYCVYPQKCHIKHDDVDKTLKLRWV